MRALQFLASNDIFLIIFKISESLVLFFDTISAYTMASHTILGTFLTFSLIKNVAVIFTIKLTLSIMFLILIRGGTPRYRYDYLTKLGWLKFFGLTVIFFLTLVFIYFLF